MKKSKLSKTTKRPSGRLKSSSRTGAPAKQAPGPKKSAPIPEATTTLTIRVPNGNSYAINLGTDFKRKAMYWEYVLRNRIRWSRNDQAYASVVERCIQTLKVLGLDAPKLSEIAAAGVVEIEIPYTAEDEGWEFRIFPWEFLLTTSTSKERSGSPLIVLRHVRRSSGANVPLHAPKKLMVVESAPGALGDMYSFTSERRLVQSNLGLSKVLCPANPTLNDLTRKIGRGRPDVIHLAGFDAHQGKQLLRESTATWDGYFLAGPNGTPAVATAEELAAALRGGTDHHIYLVCCNFYNSGARVSALIAGESAQAAIGFQDEIDDVAAENFFATFYFAWRALNWDLLGAFRLAIRDTDLGGAAVVLWSARSLLLGIQEKPLQADTKQVHDERKKPSRQNPLTMDPHDVLDPVVKLKETVNYSLLQNDENLFEEFSVRKLCDGPIKGIGIEVNLFVGSDSFPYSTIFDTEDSIVHLASKIRFPLTSGLLRSVRESVNTVISVKVTWNDKIRYLDTKPIKLLAIDEWVDTPELDAYLPSFVFPRDRAVGKVIDSAQRYLMSLSDDSTAGFDGYQGIDPSAKDPFASVDLQARAIWSALNYDLPLSYINPPPTFTESSQRLRTPSDVIDGRRGTCIDLALLLAACLEYVGIFPVIFLLTAHAFPGYWRSEEARQMFIDMRRQPTSAGGDLKTLDTRDTRTPPKPWMFNNYAEAVQLARGGDLVPVETIWLTRHEGFWEAVDEGMNDLRSKREFACMIDVQGARCNKPSVTPLPILGAAS
jgi:hypothetical protein